MEEGGGEESGRLSEEVDDDNETEFFSLSSSARDRSPAAPRERGGPTDAATPFLLLFFTWPVPDERFGSLDEAERQRRKQRKGRNGKAECCQEFSRRRIKSSINVEKKTSSLFFTADGDEQATRRVERSLLHHRGREAHFFGEAADEESAPASQNDDET